MLGKNLFGKKRRRLLLNDMLKQVKNGDVLLREKLIADYQPFIIKTVSQVMGKYIEIENSEEFSIGMIAFNEAIDCFDESKNPIFLDFCEYVIKRRLIDYLRKNKNNARVYPFTYFEDEDGSFNERYLERDLVLIQHESIEIQEQIKDFEKDLLNFDITMDDLVRYSPKHKDSRQTAIRAARILAGHDDLYQYLMKNKKIPLVELAAKAGINKRPIEKNRKFIIAVCLILKSSYGVLKGYIPDAGEGGDNR